MIGYPDRNPENEADVIGAITVRGATAVRDCIDGGLLPDHFTDPLARNVFIVASDMANNGHEINLSSLTVEARKRNLIDMDDISRLADFGSVASGTVDLTPYVSEVVELARRRRSMLLASEYANGNLGALDALRDAIDELEPGASKTSNPLTRKIRSYIEDVTGTFTTSQLCADLGMTGTKDKVNTRVILHRLKDNLIEPDGNRAGTWRVINSERVRMNLLAVQEEEAPLRFPLDLHDCATIHPGNIIVITGDPNAGKTGFLLYTIKENLDRWKVHYFNSEMGEIELRKRLDLFSDFPIGHKNFHPYEHCVNFHDVIEPGKGNLNVIDYLEISDDFFKIGGYLNKIHQKLSGAVAIVALQKRDKNSDLPLGAQRALEKPRLAVALRAGSPNTATIIKCKNRKVSHSLDGYKRDFKLINGCVFHPASDWYP